MAKARHTPPTLTFLGPSRFLPPPAPGVQPGIFLRFRLVFPRHVERPFCFLLEANAPAETQMHAIQRTILWAWLTLRDEAWTEACSLDHGGKGDLDPAPSPVDLSEFVDPSDPRSGSRIILPHSLN